MATATKCVCVAIALIAICAAARVSAAPLPSVIGASASSSSSNSTLPVVLWHGMGDSCCNPQSMGYISKLIQQEIPGTFVHSIEIGDSVDDDIFNSFFMDVNKQVADVCSQLAAIPELADGFNAVTFSQGGQFMRAYVQRCNYPAVHNLVTLGGQHQGVYGLPQCLAVKGNKTDVFCEIVRRALTAGAYAPVFQDTIVQAEYYQDPLNEELYLQASIFLADINNAKAEKNATYKANLMTLNKFVMIKFTEDTMVQPRESEWFGFYAPGQDIDVLPLNQTDLYTEDWLGLKEMDEAGKLDFLSCPGNHLQFTEEYFIDNVIPYLK